MPILTKGLQAFCKTACSLIPPIPLTLETITVKAAEISKLLLAEKEKGKDILMAEEEDALKNLAFSKTWAYKWLKRNDYISKFLHGEAGSIDKAAIAEWIAEIQQEISKYDPEDIYNMDETSLNYCLLPRQSYVHKSASGARGTKNMKSKDRVTLYVATNSTGTHKVPLAMIGNSKKPRCLG